MTIRVLRTEKEYRQALTRIELLFDVEKDSPEGDELDLLATLVDIYETNMYPIEAPDPIEFLKNVMEFSNRTQKDLAALLNSRSRASELLNRKRSLTLENIRAISKNWDVPTDPLIKEYATV